MNPIAATTLKDVLITIFIVSIVMVFLVFVARYLIIKIIRMLPDDDIMMNEEQFRKDDDTIDWY